MSKKRSKKMGRNFLMIGLVMVIAAVLLYAAAFYSVAFLPLMWIGWIVGGVGGILLIVGIVLIVINK